MKHTSLILGMAVLAMLTFSGCSLFPSDTSRPVMRYPARPAPAYPVPAYPKETPSDTSVTSSPVTNGGTDVIEQIAMDKKACEAARGHWNECASPCRNDPDAKVCVMSCMAVCECGGFPGFGCPAGYECTDFVPKGAIDALGICKPQIPMTFNEFKSSKYTPTSVVVQGRLENGNVSVNSPKFLFYGTTTVFENQFSWRVKDGAGKIIAHGQAQTDSPDMGVPGAFRVTAELKTIPTADGGKLDIYDNSPKDGAEQILVSVPLNFEVLIK